MCPQNQGKPSSRPGIEGERAGGVTAQAVTARVLKEYERYLRRKFDAWAQVASRLSAVRSYTRWAVATGRLGEEDLLVVRTVSKQKPHLKKRRPSGELYEGAETFDGWLKDRGRSLATIQAQGYMLRSIGRWCLGKGLGTLTPAIATPALLDEYWQSSGQVERLFAISESRQILLSTPAELVALIDSLGNGTLNEHQRQTLQALRDGILSLVMVVPAQV